MPIGWRIDKPGRKAFTGEGARRYGGRWNSPGTAVVYLSAHLSLAALEIMVHQRPLTPRGKYVAWQLEWEDRQIERLPVKALPRNWRESPPGPASMSIGDRMGAGATLARSRFAECDHSRGGKLSAQPGPPGFSAATDCKTNRFRLRSAASSSLASALARCANGCHLRPLLSAPK